MPLNDGVKRIFLSTKGKNKDTVPTTLIDFLGYLNDSTDSYVEHSSSQKVKEIHERIKVLKKNRDVEKRYMHYLYVDKLIEEKDEELKEKDEELKEKDEELKEKDEELTKAQNLIREMILETLDRLGNISEDVRKNIECEKDIIRLEAMYKSAINAACSEQFEKQIVHLS